MSKKYINRRLLFTDIYETPEKFFEKNISKLIGRPFHIQIDDGHSILTEPGHLVRVDTKQDIFYGFLCKQNKSDEIQILSIEHYDVKCVKTFDICDITDFTQIIKTTRASRN